MVDTTDATSNSERRSRASQLGARWHAASVVARREIAVAGGGATTTGSVVIALGLAAWIVSNQLRLVLDNDVLVLADPFRPAVGLAVTILSLAFGVSAVVSVSRERDSGTLETLFYGPIDEISYLAGKLAGLLVTFAGCIALVFAGIVAMGVVSGFEVTGPVVAASIVSVVPMAAVIAFGLLVAAVARRLRTALLLFIGITVVLVTTSTAYAFLVTLPVEDPSSPLLAARDAVGAVDRVVRAVSPYAYLERAVDSAAIGAWGAAGAGIVVSAASAAILLGLAALALRRNGVRRGRG